MMAAESELGALVAYIGTDRRRRLRIFLWAVPVGAAGTALGVSILVMMAVLGLEIGFVSIFGALLTAFGLVALIQGGRQGWLLFTRRDEEFRLYEGGLVHAYAGRSRPVRWDEIVKVSDRSGKFLLGSAFGLETYYRVKLAPAPGARRVIVITALTYGARQLGETVRNAVENGARPRQPKP